MRWVWRERIPRRPALRAIRALGARWTLAAVAAALVTMVLASCTIDGPFKYTETKMETRTVPVEGIATLETRLGSADITVVTKEGTDAEFIITKTYKAHEREYGENLLAETAVKIERQGSRLVLTRENTKKVNVDVVFKGYVSIEITATLPAGIALDILTGSGDILVGDRTAAILIHSGSGDITVGGAAGGIDVKSGSGDVRLQQAKGTVKFTSGSGDFFGGDIEGVAEGSTGSGEVNIEKIVGDLTVSTGSGDVSVLSATGKVSARSGSGDMEFRGHKGGADILTSSGDIAFATSATEGEIDLKTSSGDIGVTLYGVESAELDISTLSGAITSKVPIVIREASRRHLVGVAGDGRLKLKIETSSGSVSVDKGSI
ncbi:MAG: DUF4097 family beta strand repeat-containing protein [Candidatus Eisenbacteria bacterium]